MSAICNKKLLGHSLARISHRFSTASGDMPGISGVLVPQRLNIASAMLRLLGPAVARIAGHLTRLATKSGEKCGLVLGLFILLFTNPCQAEQGTKLHCQLLPFLFKLFTENHYMHKKLTDTICSNTVEQFIKTLDHSKTLLYQSDIPTLKKKLHDVFNTVNKGKCTGLESITPLLVERAKESEDFVKAFVGKDYKLDETVEIMIDPKKRDYPKNLKEKQEILVKFIHFQIQSYLLAEIKLEQAKKNLLHRYELVTKRFSDEKIEDHVEEFAAAFARSLDPHTSYLSYDDMEDFRINMKLSLEGIGASLSSQDGFTVIEALIKGGGAEKSGRLKPKDKIMAVAQGEKGEFVNVVDMELREVVKLIRGKKGTKVKLSILRQSDETKTLEVIIDRDKIDLEEKAAKMRYVEREVSGKKIKVGIVELSSFYGGGEGSARNASDDMRKLLIEAKGKGVEGIVLDLSQNGGGILEEAVKITGLFINRGDVVATKDLVRTRYLDDDEDGVVYSGPLVVLTSRVSASGAEILAGALKDYGRAVIVGGDHTFGKGSVQTLTPLPLGVGAMKVTMGLFFLPAGYSTQEKGVSSHIIIPTYLDDYDVGEKMLDYALPMQSIRPFLSQKANTSDLKTRWQPVAYKLIEALNEKSEKRVKKDPKFVEIKKKVEKRKKNEGILKLAEISKDNAEEKKSGKKDEKKDEDVLYLETAQVIEGMNILTDWISLEGAKHYSGTD